MAITAARKAPKGFGDIQNAPVAAATVIYRGHGVCLDSSGNAVKPSETTGLVTIGVALTTVDNSAGLAADESVDAEAGTFIFDNSSSSDEITKAEIGDVCYWGASGNVCKTNGSATRSVAGVVKAVDDEGVHVQVGVWPLQVGLLAANNLSDVGSASTARASIGANQVEFTFYCEDLVAANAARFGFVAPKAFTITKIKSVLLGAVLTAGNCTLTGKIGGVAITSGVLTITQSGSAIGDVDTAAPSAANVVAEDQFVEVLVGGANTATGARAQVTVYGTY